MPRAQQRSERGAGQHRPQYSQSSDPDVRLTEEGIKAFLDTCREKGLVEGTVDCYRRGLKHLYHDLLEDKTIRHGMLERWREDLMGQGYACATMREITFPAKTAPIAS